MGCDAQSCSTLSDKVFVLSNFRDLSLDFYLVSGEKKISGLDALNCPGKKVPVFLS